MISEYLQSWSHSLNSKALVEKVLTWVTDCVSSLTQLNSGRNQMTQTLENGEIWAPWWTLLFQSAQVYFQVQAQSNYACENLFAA